MRFTYQLKNTVCLVCGLKRHIHHVKIDEIIGVEPRYICSPCVKGMMASEIMSRRTDGLRIDPEKE